MIRNKEKEIALVYRYLKWAIVAVVFFWLFLHSRFHLMSYDVWWHLRTGQFILENRFIPHTDIYSYTAFGQPWITHEWVAQIIFFLTHKLSGLSGLLLFKSLIITATFFILYKALKAAKVNMYIALAATILAFSCSTGRFFLRPETISYLFVSIFLYLLYLYKHQKRDYLYALPLLMIIWANTHATALVGCGILFIFALCERSKRLWLIAGLVFLASFINVNGYNLHLFLFKCQAPWPLVKLPLHGLIEENIRPSLTMKSYYSIFFYACLISVILNYKKLDLTNLSMFIAGFGLSQLAARHIEIFAIMSTPLLAGNMSNIASRVSHFISQRKTIRNLPIHNLQFTIRGPTFQILVIMGILTVLIHHKCYSHPFELKDPQVRRSRYPVDATAFIENNKIYGNMYNSYGFGGYLIWKLYPERKVFIDGRTEVYLNGVLKDYDDLDKIPAGDKRWREIFDKYNIDFAILEYSLDRKIQNLSTNLHMDKEWILVYWDEASLVYIKDIPEYKEIIKKYAYQIVNPVDPTFHYLKAGADYKKAIAEFKRKIKEDPKCFVPYDRLGMIYEKQGNLKEAAGYFRKVVELTPYSAISHFNLGLINQRMDLDDEAMREYNSAIRLDKRHHKAYIQIGLLYFIDKEYNKAIRNFKRAIRATSHEPRATDIELAYLYLGASYQNIGKYKPAKVMYEKVLQIHPGLEDADKNLEKLKAKGFI